MLEFDDLDPFLVVFLYLFAIIVLVICLTPPLDQLALGVELVSDECGSGGKSCESVFVELPDLAEKVY